MLLDKGAHINTRTQEGETALSIARDSGREEVVQLLRRRGAKE
jgi:ankyrin repeat protein